MIQIKEPNSKLKFGSFCITHLSYIRISNILVTRESRATGNLYDEARNCYLNTSHAQFYFQPILQVYLETESFPQTTNKLYL